MSLVEAGNSRCALFLTKVFSSVLVFLAVDSVHALARSPSLYGLESTGRFILETKQSNFDDKASVFDLVAVLLGHKG